MDWHHDNTIGQCTKKHNINTIGQCTKKHNIHTIILETTDMHTHLHQRTHQHHIKSFCLGPRDMHLTVKMTNTVDLNIRRSIRRRIRRRIRCRQLYLFSIHLEGRGTHRHNLTRCMEHHTIQLHT